MSKILIVHGISNQYLGESELHAVWYPALCDGLSRAKFFSYPDPSDCYCPFYGDVFRPKGHLSRDLVEEPEDLETVTDSEAKLLQVIWSATAETDPDVPGPEEFGETLFLAPRIAERALNALANSKYLADYIPMRFLGDLKQVDLYLNDADTHEKVIGLVLSAIQPDTTIVIGHSLGSVVAYEAICRKPDRVSTLITLGSPLGLRYVVFDKLTPRPDGMGLGRWPGEVKKWTNIAATGDIVAAQKRLSMLFGIDVADLLIDNGWDAHSSTRYLNSEEAGRAVAAALSS
jgi:hypothetical protein